MAHLTGYNLSAFFSPRFGRKFIKRVVARQRRRAGDAEAEAQVTVERLNQFAKEPTGFQWYENETPDQWMTRMLADPESPESILRRDLEADPATDDYTNDLRATVRLPRRTTP